MTVVDLFRTLGGLQCTKGDLCNTFLKLALLGPLNKKPV